MHPASYSVKTSFRQSLGRCARERLRRLAVNSLAATIAKPIIAKNAGPSLLPPIDRRTFIGSVRTDEPVLEIGPFDRPCLSGPAIRYFDVLSQSQLRERAQSSARHDPTGCPFIDYVSPTGDLSIVSDTFAAVFSSHCIEHQPDLIGHLREVARILRPGGQYFLVIPDKRFCFDHFHAESSIEEVRAARGRTLHTEKAVGEEAVGRAHNIDLLHWLGVHGKPRTDRHAQVRKEELLSQCRAGEYVDVHAWRFTPVSFRAIIQQLFGEGQIELAPARIHDTAFGTLEFMAVLRRTG